VNDCLGNGNNVRDDKLTKSIAVGSRSFVERVKSLMGVLAIGRKSINLAGLGGKSRKVPEKIDHCSKI